MGTSTMWMTAIIGSLVVIGLATVEETVRRRAACIRLQHELRRGAYHPVRAATSVRHPGRHLRLVRAGGHRRAA